MSSANAMRDFDLHHSFSSAEAALRRAHGNGAEATGGHDLRTPSERHEAFEHELNYPWSFLASSNRFCNLLVVILEEETGVRLLLLY